jgi:hypothetical protein
MRGYLFGEIELIVGRLKVAVVRPVVVDVEWENLPLDSKTGLAAARCLVCVRGRINKCIRYEVHRISAESFVVVKLEGIEG